MVRGGIAAFVALAATLLLVSGAAAGGPGMTIGAVEDAAKWATDPAAKMNLARQAGFAAVRMTMQWSSGQVAPSAGELQNMRNAATAARAAGIEPIVAIYNTGSSSTPADDASRAQFVQFATAVAAGLPSVRRFVVGNEPNLNRYWLPQFNPDGSDAAAPAYEALLAASYDAIKSARPDAVVLGGALSSRGEDSPTSTRPTHSPTAFIRDLGTAYRASGRAAPIMDVFDQHVYEDYSAMPPSFEHPTATTIAVADYGKLVSLLGQAFDGTAQAGSTLPIFYGEYGVESIIPAAKAPLYTGTEPAASRAVDEATQAALYREAFKVAYCQPNVVGIMVFHVSDESALGAWQSGPYYADDTAKSSLAGIRAAANASRAGTLTSCPDTTPPTVTLTAPKDGATVHGTVTLTATAADDVGVGKVEWLVNGAVVTAKAVSPYSFDWASGASGQVTLTARALDAARNSATSSVTVTVDNTPPETTLTSTPPPVAASTATFQFTASEAGSTFECSLDGGTFAGCTSPRSYTGLAPGVHVFSVRATDSLGNVDQTPASYSWTVAGAFNRAANPSVDFDGDRVTDLGALYRGRSPLDSLWYAPGTAGGGPFQIYFGATSDVPVPGDYDGDGRTDAAIFRPSTGLWYGPRTGAAQIVVQMYLGESGDVPVPGDYDGDGKTDPAIWRPSLGLFFAVESGGGTLSATLGQSGDVPVPRDYDGDGKTDPAIWRPSTGGWQARLSGGGTYQATNGSAGDVPVPADYNGDGRADPVVFRPGTGAWAGPYNGAAGGVSATLGQSSDVPVPGYYDGDGAVDPAVFRPATGTWIAALSGGGTKRFDGLGVSGDVPIQKRPALAGGA